MRAMPALTRPLPLVCQRAQECLTNPQRLQQTLPHLQETTEAPDQPPSVQQTAEAPPQTIVSGFSRTGDSPTPWWASQRSASRAAMHPVPAAVMAWR